MAYYGTPQQKRFIPSLFPPSSSFPKLPREADAWVLCLGKLSQGELETQS